MPSPVVIPVWGKPLKTFERNTMSLADLAKGGNVALCLYRDNGMDRGLLLSMGKRVFEGPFDRAAAQYNALVRSWWARSFPGMQVPNEHLYVAKAGNAFKVGDKFYKAVSISPDDADQIRRLLDKPHATDVDEARITRFARKYGIRQEGGSSYNRKMLAAFLEQNGESSSKAARPVMRKGLIEDGDGAPNLDSVSIDQLRAFVAEIGNGVRPVEAAKRMFPDQGKGAVEATKNLRNYAWNKITAMQARLDGNIPEAQKYEAICDRIYDALPSWARW